MSRYNTLLLEKISPDGSDVEWKKEQLLAKRCPRIYGGAALSELAVPVRLWLD
jgi:hypothetical protein